MLYFCTRFGIGMRSGVHGDGCFVMLVRKRVLRSHRNKHSARTETSIPLARKQAFHSGKNGCTTSELQCPPTIKRAPFRY